MDVLVGSEARARLGDPAFVERWRSLWAESGAGVFRSPGFVQAAIEAEEGAPVVVSEDQGTELAGLWVLAPKGPGVLGPPGGAETLRQGWLAAPLDGGFFIERAVTALLRARIGPEIHLHRLPPGSPVEWARSGREVGRVSRLSQPPAQYALLDPARAARSLEDKLHSAQLAALRTLGPAVLEVDPPDAAELVAQAAAWHDQRTEDQGLERRYADEPRRVALLRRLAGGLLRVLVLRAGGRVVSVQALYLYGSEALLALAAEPPDRESIATGLIHWLMLEPWLIERGVQAVDVSAGPSWLGLMATRRTLLDSVTIYGRLRDRARGDAEAALLSLSRWALQRLER